MRRTILVVFIVGCTAGVMAGTNLKVSSALSVQDRESKTLLKEYLLATDSRSEKWGEVVFNHETHSTENYSIDGKSVVTCVECHHTDQPVASLKPPLKTSERPVALTATLLDAADSKPVKSCRACHLQTIEETKSAQSPSLKYPDKPKPTKLTNEFAYHRNCFESCHDKALAARPALNGKVPGKENCEGCHKRIIAM